MNKLKNFFKNKQNIILVTGIFLCIIVVLITVIITNKNTKKFSLNSIYDVYPEEVRKIYSNIVSVSCSGDLYLGIKIENGEVNIRDIDKTVLANYLFSYLDKNNKINNDLTIDVINNNSKKLFNGNIKFNDIMNGYSYNNYKYLIKDNSLVKEKNKCISDIKYISNLFGYSYNKKELSMDINIGYLKDGILYDLTDNELGKYDGDVKKLQELFKDSPYYRYNYIKDKDGFKLNSVKLNSRE